MVVDFGNPLVHAALLGGLAVSCALLSHLAWRRAMAQQLPGRDVRSASAGDRRRDLGGFFTEDGRRYLRASGAWGKLAMLSGGGGVALVLLSAIV